VGVEGGAVQGVLGEGVMDRKRVRVLISGWVQGVFFRAYTRDAALREGLTGWVRNLADGRVEAVFEGDADRVDRMIAWCHQGSPGSRVDHVEVLPQPYQGEFRSFEIRRHMLD
jgi:acylphosphatase